MGYFKQMEGYKALYLSGRRKFVIKQKGYNVFPGEVEEHISRMEGVDVVEVIGMKHGLFDEGIFAFVRPSTGVTLDSEAVMEHCKTIASYKRPQHVEIWPSDKEFPLTRSTKVDKLELAEIAAPIVENLRKTGKWDQKK
jgi:acyl-CoA synthetase (AMP-forming)/AMP-acid ligase II